jgi:hypothetical protein
MRYIIHKSTKTTLITHGIKKEKNITTESLFGEF